MADSFDPEAIFPIRKVTFLQKMFLRACIPVYLAKMFLEFYFLKFSPNPLHDGVRNLSGKKVISTGKLYCLETIKASAKNHNITINDLLTACLSTAVKDYFVSKGDLTTKSINFAIPANIRFKPYKSAEDLILENKFSVVPLQIPLYENIDEALKKIPHALKRLKTAFNQVYATYAM